MSIESILNRYGIGADTSDTLQNFLGVSARPAQDNVCTPDTRDTHENEKTKQIKLVTDQKREERLQKVLSMLADNPDQQRAYISDDKTDQDHVILTVAIRDLACFEMLIPKSKYDPFILLELINKAHLQ